MCDTIACGIVSKENKTRLKDLCDKNVNSIG